MKRPHFIFFYISVLLMFSSCSGCSESGLQHRAAQQQAQDEENFRDESFQHTQPERNQTPQTPSSEPVGNQTLSELFELNKSAVFMVFTEDEKNVYQGTGFFISSDGLAVSNYHIFEGTLKGNEIIVTESEMKFRVERVLEQSKDKDYIIFEVNGMRNVNYLQIAKKSPYIGENVFAIGNPRGLNKTLSTGIISGYRLDDEFIQTSTEITHGSSGGPLMNMKGEVIGITTSGIGEANLNFAVNIQELNLQRFLQ